MERKIIHLNIADFGVAVERRLDSALRGRPLILAPAAARAVVYDMSEEAYQDGVRKGMALTQAKKRCRAALILSPRPERYRLAMQRCIRHALEFTPLVEESPGSGHLYLDVTGTHRLHGPAPDIGWRLRKLLRHDLGLDPIWSVAPNKLVAKVASRLVKPLGEYIVADGEEQPFLAPLPLALLPGLTDEELERLGACNIRLAVEVAALSPLDLTLFCGRRARFVYQAVRGIDGEPVLPPGNPRGHLLLRHDFAGDSNQEEVVRTALNSLVRQAVLALAGRNLGCRWVAVHLRYSDGLEVKRRVAGKGVTGDDQILSALAGSALRLAWRRRVRVRSLELLCTGLYTQVRQLSLFAGSGEGATEKQEKISAALNAIQTRCGLCAIARGSVPARQMPSPP